MESDVTCVPTPPEPTRSTYTSFIQIQLCEYKDTYIKYYVRLQTAWNIKQNNNSDLNSCDTLNNTQKNGEFYRDPCQAGRKDWMGMWGEER